MEIFGIYGNIWKYLQIFLVDERESWAEIHGREDN